MRPNLSLETFAGALAVLGTGVIMAACGGDAKTPVNATEATAPATDKASTSSGTADPVKAPETSAAAMPASTASAMPASTAASTAAASTAMGAAPAPATSASATKKPAAGGATPAPASTAKKGGSSSCGAGTCSAKK